ncbi:hypothetical protein HHL17_29170 [Chitinophaga sp. G-6-1-13]|uniref:Uncharacterized protein n=1 Tax=Chitinophaga fulva TaxID=2728842 RepID=A0A848GX50_9BACT|nr:hypothetical protein [Chitinophaga fulva]NML41300.1 hypothetical protein [Chitinophaga fulva]
MKQLMLLLFLLFSVLFIKAQDTTGKKSMIARPAIDTSKTRMTPGSPFAMKNPAKPAADTGNKRGLTIKPSTIDFKLNNGQTGAAHVFIVNHLNKKKQFSLYLMDWIRDSLGVHVYTAPGTTERSCARWIKLERTFVEVDTGQTVDLPIKMQVPDSAAATGEMKWTMLFLETTEEQVVESPTGLKTNVTNKVRVGVHLYQTPPSLTYKDVKILSFDHADTSARICHITCQNTGTVQLECTGYLELSNIATGDKTKIDVPMFPLFPEQRRVVEFVIPDKVPKGKYSLIGVIDAGTDVPMEAAQEMIDI